MPLSSGTRLGSYEIVSAIGAGGMGEVYRATDTTLGRQVAIKLLPESFVGNHERTPISSGIGSSRATACDSVIDQEVQATVWATSA